MRNLVTAGLVEQIFPGEHIERFPQFTEEFIRYTRHRLTHIRRSDRTKTDSDLDKAPRPSRKLLHIEKLGRVADELQNLGLASPRHYPWYEVDSWVADAFMAYLASILGGIEDINAAPVTYHYNSFRLLGGVWASKHPRSTTAFNIRRTASRQILLERIFPVPKGQISIDEIIRFKRDHGAMLRLFRNQIEAKCIDLANILDAEARQERTMVMARELETEIEQISEAMRATWRDIAFSWVAPLLGVGATLVATDLNQPGWQLGAGAAAIGFSLVGAVYQASAGSRQRQELLQRPLAYAAFTQRDLY
jgi:hypothetical protein